MKSMLFNKGFVDLLGDRDVRPDLWQQEAQRGAAHAVAQGEEDLEQESPAQRGCLGVAP